MTPAEEPRRRVRGPDGSAPPAERQVRVHLAWPPGVLLGPGAVARVRVEDVTRLDESSVVVAERVVTGLDRRRPRSVTLRVPGVEDRARYCVRVHVSAAGRDAADGVARGDLLTTRSHPVLTGGAPDEVTVTPQLVG